MARERFGGKNGNGKQVHLARETKNGPPEAILAREGNFFGSLPKVFERH